MGTPCGKEKAEWGLSQKNAQTGDGEEHEERESAPALEREPEEPEQRREGAEEHRARAALHTAAGTTEPAADEDDWTRKTPPTAPGTTEPDS